jgi:signal transduction histidine kinase
MGSPASSLPSALLRLLFFCTAVLIFVLLASNVGVILSLRESALDDQEVQLKNAALTLAEQADRTLQSVDLVITSVADGIAGRRVGDEASFIAAMAGEDTHLLLHEKISGVPQLNAVALTDADGNVVNSSRSWPVQTFNVADRDYFHAARDDFGGMTYVSAPALSRATGVWMIFLSRRIAAPDGTFLGAVVGAMEMRYFEEFYGAIALGKDSSIALQRLDGTMLARYPPTNAIGKTFSNANLLLRDGVSGSVRAPSPIDGQMRLKAARRVAHYPVLLLATTTEEAALANWRNIAQMMTLGALGCGVSIAIAAFALARQWRQQSTLTEARAELRRQADLAASLDAMRAAKEAAELADRAKSEFLATMSHELRTPLNAVLGFSEMMLSEVFGPLGNERYLGYAEDIRSSGRHLLSIINDVLDLSKASSGKLELFEGDVDAGNAVEAACRLVQPRVAAAGLSLAMMLPKRPLTVIADERLLKQILLNLLANACKFTPRGGGIVCAVAQDAEGLCFRVTDTGIGIPQEDLERVLQPFVQADSSHSRRHEGTGLGLALVKAMVELHGGRLTLESTVGEGTTATVILPASRVVVVVEPGQQPVTALAGD